MFYLDNQKKYTLEEYQGKAYKPLFEPFLYGQDGYLIHQSNDKPVIFLILNGENCLGRIYFFLNDTKAFSPGRSPFGCWQLAPDIPYKILITATAEICRILNEREIGQITVTCSPGFYSDDNNASLTYALLRTGFQLVKWEINHHLDLRRDFTSRLHVMEKRRQKKCIDAAFEFKVAEISELEQVYNFIRNCREERDHGLSLQLKDLKSLADDFPDNYKIFSVQKNNELAAASISVMVNKYILYNFYPAAALKFKSFSPLVFLSGELVKYCLDSGIKFIDLGTSVMDDKPNISLIQFKERIGGIPSLKYTFSKRIN